MYLLSHLNKVKMRFALALLAAVAAAAAMPQEVFDQRNQRIMGGFAATIEQYPYSVVLLSNGVGSTFTQSCGGTILNQRSVLSGATCFHIWRNPAQWRSRVGSTWSNRGGRVIDTESIIRIPGYSPVTLDNDFAILRLSEFLTWSHTIAPGSIAGANYNLADNEAVWAIGWGQTSQGGYLSEGLRHVQIWTVNHVLCRQRYASRNVYLTNNMLCAGWLDVGGRDQCQGDGGSPVLHNNVVVGLGSFNMGCGEAYFPGVSARVSSASNWIVANA